MIICIGNRFVAEDDAGIQVFSTLQKMAPLPAGIDLIEGGTAGLNLLPLLEKGGRVVFVDAVRGFTDPGTIVLLNSKDITANPALQYYDHNAGLPYVLTALPHVCDGDMPEEIFLIGLEGECSPDMVEQAASLSIAVAKDGWKDLS